MAQDRSHGSTVRPESTGQCDDEDGRTALKRSVAVPVSVRNRENRNQVNRSGWLERKGRSQRPAMSMPCISRGRGSPEYRRHCRAKMAAEFVIGTAGLHSRSCEFSTFRQLQGLDSYFHVPRKANRRPCSVRMRCDRNAGPEPFAAGPERASQGRRTPESARTGTHDPAGRVCVGLRQSLPGASGDPFWSSKMYAWGIVRYDQIS